MNTKVYPSANNSTLYTRVDKNTETNYTLKLPIKGFSIHTPQYISAKATKISSTEMLLIGETHSKIFDTYSPTFYQDVEDFLKVEPFSVANTQLQTLMAYTQETEITILNKKYKWAMKYIFIPTIISLTALNLIQYFLKLL